MKMALPAGYRMVSKNSLNIVFKEGYAENFEGFTLPDAARRHGSQAGLHGRGQLISMPLGEGEGERMLIRSCIRGGVLGRFLQDKYLNHGTPRPMEELKISEFAQAQGIPTPDVLAVAVERVSPFFYRGALAVREISPSRDLQAEFLAIEHPPERGTIKKKRQIMSLSGGLVAKMHDAGIYHADLHLKNILISEEEESPKLYLLDFDAAKIFRPLSDLRKCLNLLRLYRSAEKVNRRNHVITRTDLLRFLHSYAGKSSNSFRELVAKLNRMLPLWRLKWKLSDMLGV
jgi:tRNA A-37 threonylcarbamoyl transferase component Bud32